MSDLTELSLRRFTQKIAGHAKQANPLTALTPNVLGGLGGAAMGGLGLYGIARALQSEEDRKRRGMTPALAGLAGALAGGAGGYLGTEPLIAALRGRGHLQQSISGVDDAEPQYVNGSPNAALAQAQNATPPKPVGRTPSEYDYRPPTDGGKKPAPAKENKPAKSAPKQPEAERDYRPPGFRD